MEEKETIFNEKIKGLLENYLQPAIQNAHKDGIEGKDILAGLFVSAMSFSMVFHNSDKKKAKKFYKEMSKFSGEAYLKNFE